MITPANTLALIVAYLLGSIPSAVWVGKIFYGIDVREYGSGNAGATNTFRVLGWKAGTPVLFMDTAKGWLAVKIAWLSGLYLPNSQQLINFELALGISSLAGHVFPVFAGFRGGKGVATLLGVLIAVQPWAALWCACIFVVVLFISHFVSLGSILAALAFPFIIMLIYKETLPTVNLFSMAISILVLTTHQKNIERLLRGKEPKVNFLGGKKKK
ncbi:MAG: glycerol-3-phosphate 1-O-acyltransferase PlsY [Bacteroidia bacterium]|nr:glycerol-3-phosphate 1-O-acyltransferase PlsY [Bacteroidia bacterium]MCZ2277947.1 glycerol-3-phosphate 1-O-acyltransferase PlsY [Bacteroidia bacterium]